jgi:hypothetical protein
MPASKKAPAPKRGPGSDDDFVFESSAGEITVPSLTVADQPPPIVVTEIVDEFEESRAAAKLNLLFLRTACGDDAYAVVRLLPASELKTFTEKWQDHSGISLGEFRAS